VIRAPFKVCSKCSGVYSATTEFFYRQGTGNRNPLLRADCKRCQLEDKKRYRTENPELLAERERRYRETHEDQIAAKDRRYREADPERQARRHRVYRQANPEKKAAIKKRRAERQAASPVRHTEHDVLAQYVRQGGRCYWCGGDLSDGYETDHVIPLAKGGSDGPENIVVACRPCNQAKGSKLPQEFCGRLA
jgi:5-methylcytosine-specific restriction endonuclease McrA